MSNYYFIEDYEKTRSAIYDTKLKADNEQDALKEALDIWNRLGWYDQSKCANAYVVSADEDEDGCIDLDSFGRQFIIWDGKEEQIIVNSNGYLFTADQWRAMADMMDDEIRERLHCDLAPCSMQEFFTAYAEAHEEKFGEQWELDKANPCW